MDRRPARGSEGGFTLLEVLVALVILGVAVVSLMQLSSRSLRLVKTSGDYQQAVLLADRIATQSQPTDEGTDGGQEGPFVWERRVALVAMPDALQPTETIPGRDPAKLFAVTIDVRWGRGQQVEVATMWAPVSPPPNATQTQTGAPGSQQTGSNTSGQSGSSSTPKSGGSSSTSSSSTSMGGLGSR